MKKILSFLLAIMMVASFAACSDEQENVGENVQGENSGVLVEALNKTFTAVIYGDEEDKEFWEKAKSAFESENSDIKITMIVTEEAAYEVRDRILSGNSPDFVYLPSDEESGVTEALVLDKALVSLEDVVAAAPSGAFENNVCRPYEDGNAYVAPYFFETVGLIYNKEFLSKNGFSVPNTWDEFVKIAEDCKNKNFEFFTYAGFEPDEFVNIFAAALVPEIGVDGMEKLLSYDEEAWKGDSVKKFIENIEKVKKLVVSGSSTKTKDDVLEDLKDEDVLFVSGTTADLEELNKDGDKYAICAYPAQSGAKTEIVSFSEMYIPVEAAEVESAKKFMTFLYGEKAASLMESTAYQNVFTPEFESKSAANPDLADEFCGLIVEVFKSNVSAKDFQEEMLELIKEY